MDAQSKDDNHSNDNNLDSALDRICQFIPQQLAATTAVLNALPGRKPISLHQSTSLLVYRYEEKE